MADPHREQPDRFAVMDAQTRIAHLQQSVEILMDGDRVLLADGSSLLALLERALTGLAAENTAAARAGIAAFSSQVQALIEAGVLETADGRPHIEAAAALDVVLRSADGTDGETRTR